MPQLRQKGHIVPVCCSRPKQPPPHLPKKLQSKLNSRALWVTEGKKDDTRELNPDDELPLYTLRDNSHPLYAKLLFNGKPVEMEVDIGAAVSLISQRKLCELSPNYMSSSKK